MDVINYAFFLIILYSWKFRSDPGRYYEHSPEFSREISKCPEDFTSGDIYICRDECGYLLNLPIH